MKQALWLLVLAMACLTIAFSSTYTRTKSYMKVITHIKEEAYKTNEKE